jgi:hypothetical protein
MTLRGAYLTGSCGRAPARDHLTKTQPIYELVQEDLGISMHNLQNHESFPNGLDVEEATTGEIVSLIHEVRARSVVLCPAEELIFVGDSRWAVAKDRCGHVYS